MTSAKQYFGWILTPSRTNDVDTDMHSSKLPKWYVCPYSMPVGYLMDESYTVDEMEIKIDEYIFVFLSKLAKRLLFLVEF